MRKIIVLGSFTSSHEGFNYVVSEGAPKGMSIDQCKLGLVQPREQPLSKRAEDNSILFSPFFS